ncbi:hypothetical protein CASFOL_017775 [Castilleja foliolosa]|uniref:Uncharacterized protein n=1 Tax=Castilleja foliolosa TaxID=1961234 RepID=A0ABD3DAZ6_9LAMI
METRAFFATELHAVKSAKVTDWFDQRLRRGQRRQEILGLEEKLRF